MTDLALTRRVQSISSIPEADFEAVRSYRESYEADASADPSLEDADPALAELADKMSADEIAARISNDARDLVVRSEVSSRQHYERKLHRPMWPEAASGVTIGIGYDIGYNSREEFAADWKDLLPEAIIARLAAGVGVRGQAAKPIAAQLSDISVPWDAALEVFRRTTMPKFGRKVIKAFPGALDLHPHSFGALFSLVYNRGDSMVDKPGQRTRKHMRNIRDKTAARAFDKIPAEFRDMKSVWAGTSVANGLASRREAEAVLFEAGLAETAAAAALAAAAQTGEPAPALESAEASYVGDGQSWGGDFELESPPAAVLESDRWAHVKWNENDDDSPDYHHVVDRSATGKTFEFSAEDLESLIAAGAFEPIRTSQRIIFALRGAQLVKGLTDPNPVNEQVDRAKLTLKDARPDHRNFRCVIGFCDLSTGRLTAYIGSTVPCRQAIDGFVSGRSGCNILPTGCYEFIVGPHGPAKKPGMVREHEQKTVIRTKKDVVYDIRDNWDEGPVGDNLHPSFFNESADFSSWGCLTVSGNFKNGVHSGLWLKFRQGLGLLKSGTGDHGKRFDVLLLTGLEAATAATLRQSQAGGASGPIPVQYTRLRQGSRGDFVKRLQEHLQVPPTGKFNYALRKKLADHQKAKLGWADGVYAPAMDGLLGFKVFEPAAPPAPDPAVVASAPNGAPAALESTGGGENDFESLYYTIGMRSLAAASQPETVLESSLPYNQQVALEMNFSDVAAYGKRIFDRIEVSAQNLICGDNPEDAADRTRLRAAMDTAARRGGDAVKATLGAILTSKLFIPSFIASEIAEVIVGRVLRPAADELGRMTLPMIEDRCKTWTAELKKRALEGPRPSA